MSLYGHILQLVKERIKPICDFCFFHPTLLFNLVFDLCPQQSFVRPLDGKWFDNITHMACGSGQERI